MPLLIQIDRTQIQAGEVLSSHLADGVVVSGKIDVGAIDASNLFGAGVVDNTALGADAVDGTKIADNAVDSEHIASGAIDDAHLSSGAKAGVLASKRVIQLVASADLSNPNAATVAIQGAPESTEFAFATTAGVLGDGSVTGIPVLLETAAGNSVGPHGFNTNSNKIYGGEAGRYSAQVFDLDGTEIVDGNGNRVWAIVTTSARTTGGSYTIRFYADEWSTGAGEIALAAPYTMAQQYQLAYPVIVDLSTMSIDSFRSDTIKLSKSAAGILGGSIGTDELENGAVTTDKFADAAVTADKIDDGAVTSGKLASGAVDEVALDAGVVLSRAELANLDASYGGVVMASDTSSEGKVTALAAPGMAVRVQTGGVGYTPQGGRIAIPTSASLTIGDADADDARYDAVVCTAAGALAVRAGTADPSPVLPGLTAGDVLLGVVKVAAAVTDIQAGAIFDHRRTANPRKQDISWDATQATTYDLPRRALGRVSPFRNGSRIVRATSPATADEFAVSNPPESNGSRITLGAAPTLASHVQIDYAG